MRMKKIATKLEGVYIIEPKVLGDRRGYFMETWSTRNFEELGLHYDFVQDNQSYSAQKGVLRGIHFQNLRFGIPVEQHEDSYKIDLADGYITTDKA